MITIFMIKYSKFEFTVTPTPKLIGNQGYSIDRLHLILKHIINYDNTATY